MEQLTRAFDAILGALLDFGAFCMVFVREIDVFARARMTELGWAPGVQSLVEVVLAATIVLFLLRVFAPVLRVLLIVLLVLLALQFVYPPRARHAEAPCAWVAG